MKSLRNLAVCAIACALCSAAPTRGVEPKTAPTQDEARQQAVKEYFAAPAPTQPNPDRKDPKWVESMQRLLMDLSDDNARLRVENEQLRAEHEALRKQLAAAKANQGVFNVRPEALRNLQVPPGGAANEVPPNWRPFEFNGATYYVVPLAQGAADDKASPSQTIVIPAPEAKK